MPAQRLRTGIIGAGRIGRVHAQNLAFFIRNATPVSIVDIDLAAARETANANDIPNVGTNHRAILEDPEIDAVLLCSATETHADFIQELAKAGKHIFCEKPIALDLQRTEEALQAVKQAGVKFQVGFNRRFDINFHRIRETIQHGGIGEPYLLKITSRDPAPPSIDYIRESGGIFLDMTIHDFDMARFLIGSEVVEVFAAGTCLIDSKIAAAGDVDTALIHLKFENGVLGVIDNSRQAVYGYDQRVEVLGSKGMVQVRNPTPDTVATLSEQAVFTSLPHYFFPQRYQAAYVAEIQSFVDCVLNDTPPLVTGIDGLMPLKIGLAAKKSLAENRPVLV